MADTKLSALTELAATPANDDELYIRDISEVAADESKRITMSNLVLASVAADGYAKSSSGSYAGNDAAQRAIPHGLGVTPKLVVIVDSGATFVRFRTNALARLWWFAAASNDQLNMTAMTTTNFYVGYASYESETGNATGTTYYWAAIG